MLLAGVLFIVGLVFIIKGGDYFVDAASWFSEKTGIPKLIVGATVVSFATTLPELLVSITATLEGVTGIAVGNAVGSAVANTGLIMGISIFMMPVAVKLSSFLDKGLLMIVATISLAFITSDGGISITETAILFSMLALFFYFNVSAALSGNKGAIKVERVWDKKEVVTNLIKFAGGTLGIVIGARLLVDNGEIIALQLGIPDSVIGLTLVAIGTSLPELVTTLTAISKKESGLSIGNIIGANTIDIAMILPTCSLVAGGALTITPTTYMIDLPTGIVLMCIAIIPPIFTKKFSRWQGASMIAIYAGYLLFTIF